VRRARPHRPMTQDGTEFLDGADGPTSTEGGRR